MNPQKWMPWNLWVTLEGMGHVQTLSEENTKTTDAAASCQGAGETNKTRVDCCPGGFGGAIMRIIRRLQLAIRVGSPAPRLASVRQAIADGTRRAG